MSRILKSDKLNNDSFIINKLSHEGRGITHKNDKSVFVRGALPGEEVTLNNIAKKNGVLIANTDQVLTSSPDRIDPKCEHSIMCGGCSLQHTDTQYQMRHKQQTVAEQLTNIAKIDLPEFSSVINGDIWGYRRKARLGVRYVAKKERFLVGFREFNGRFLADIKSCQILVPKVGLGLDKLADLVSSLSIGTKIPQIEVTQADNATALLIRHLEPFSDADIAILKEFGAANDYHIYLQDKGYDTLRLLHPQNTEDAKLFYTIPEHDLTLFFKVYDFIQVNAKVNLSLINKTIEWLELAGTDHVLEGFCGIGNFSLPMAKYAASVTAIENCSSLLADADKNAKFNNVKNVNFVKDDLYNCKNTCNYADNTKFNKLFLDPPRSGAAPWLPIALSTRPSIIVYVSCHSASLARDAALLQQAGYELTNIAVANMFPHTAHVETIAQFKYKG